MSDALSEMYKEIILEHARYPKYNSPLEKYDVEEKAINRSCGDELTVQLLFHQKRIQNIAVFCSGCSICQASCSMMSETSLNKDIDGLQDLIVKFKDMFIKGNKDEHRFIDDYEQLEALRGVARFPMRVKCATLCWNALEQAIKRAL